MLLLIALELVADEVLKILETIQLLELIVHLTLCHRFNTFDVLVKLAEDEAADKCFRVTDCCMLDVVGANVEIAVGSLNTVHSSSDVCNRSQR